jgi:hypothetical protein
MKVLRSVSVFLPLALVAASIFPFGCADTECTTGTVRIEATLPESVAGQAMAVDVTFQRAGQVIRTQRVPVGLGASRVTADISFPDGYPAGDVVMVTAVARRLDAAETALANWFTTETFPKGCVGFVITLFAPQADGSTADGSSSSSDASAMDAPVLEDVRSADTRRDAMTGGAPDARGADSALDAALLDATVGGPSI